jgi:hypothetical protein
MAMAITKKQKMGADAVVSVILDGIGNEIYAAIQRAKQSDQLAIATYIMRKLKVEVKKLTLESFND